MTLVCSAGSWYIAGAIHNDHYTWSHKLFKFEGGRVILSYIQGIPLDLKERNGQVYALFGELLGSGKWRVGIYELSTNRIRRVLEAELPTFARSFEFAGEGTDRAYVSLGYEYEKGRNIGSTEHSGEIWEIA
jgi:hypothetical protein